MKRKTHPKGTAHDQSFLLRPFSVTSFLGVLVGALLLAQGSTRAQPPFLISKVALSGDQAPGTPPGVVYQSFTFTFASLNALGQAQFQVQVTGPGITLDNFRGNWSGAPGSVGLLARMGDQAPGEPVGVQYFGLFQGMNNAAGLSTFGGNVGGANSSRLWLGVPGNVTLLAREGDPVPALPAGVIYDGFGDPTLNSSGQIAFPAALTGTGVTSANNHAILSGAPSSLMLLARAGDPAPGTEAGVNYSSLSANSDITLNAAGQSAFAASLVGPGITNANNAGLWLGSPGNVTLIARKGDHAPGTAAGVNYLSLSSPTLNSAGKFVFFSNLTGSGVMSSNNTGLWIGDSVGVTLAVRTGDPAPGTGVGVNYSGLPTRPSINASGRIAFWARINGSGVTTTNDTGIWSDGNGSLVKIVREGETAPGAGESTLFGETNSLNFAINDRGDVVFRNSLTGPNITLPDSLWFSDVAGTLSLIVRGGDAIEVAPGDMRVVESVSFRGGSGDEDGFTCGFNDSGQLVFLASFTDDTQGYFIATPTGTPAPTPTPGATPTATPSPTATASATPSATPTPTPTAAPSATPSATPTPVPGHAGNISTRLRVETGDNVLIGGFIVSGTQPKRLIIRAIGPSLTGLGVPSALNNPTLELHGPNGFTTVANDNWMDAPNRQEIIDTGLAPTNNFESAILVTLPANNAAYTAIVQGVNNGTGVGLVEVYDLNTAADSKLANISTRGFVQTGDNVMIGGFIVVGQSATRVILRAIGPSLSISGKLADPTLELRDVNGTLLRSDDNWRTGGQEAEIVLTGIQPSNDLESAIISTLLPGNYTAIVRGVGNETGVGLIEAYDLGPP